MIADITAVLGPGIGAKNVAKSSLPDIFEAYVLMLAIRAARAEGGAITYESRSRKIVTELVFRTSPGFIYSTAQDYTHINIHFVGKPHLEAHIGVKVAGKSGVLHELDVAVLDKAEAENCRRNSVSPRSARVLIGIECKFYASSLQLHLARGFLGLLSDLSARNPYFVTNTSSTSVEKLLSHRARHAWEKEITPACANTEVDRLVHAFRGCFKNYKAQ